MTIFKPTHKGITTLMIYKST